MVRKWTSALSLRVSPRPAYADLGQFDDAGRCISEAMAAIEKTKDEVNRIADEIALMRPKPDAGREASSSAPSPWPVNRCLGSNSAPDRPITGHRCRALVDVSDHEPRRGGVLFVSTAALALPLSAGAFRRSASPKLVRLWSLSSGLD
jgi:hypothetical protein